MDRDRSAVASLRAALADGDSTTLVLERWCAAHGLACPGGLVAQRLPGRMRPPGRARRRRLALSAHEPVRYRRVLLRCPAIVLCEAENWYVPGRLPAWMNRLLDRTTIPFGRVVEPLGFRRHRLSLVSLRLPSGDAGSPLRRHGVLRQEAMLTRSDGLPFCDLVETFTSTLLGNMGTVALRRRDEPASIRTEAASRVERGSS